MVISPTGTVLTSAHVIHGATSITVTVVATGESYQATVLGSDATRDVALLRLEGASGLDTVTLGRLRRSWPRATPSSPSAMPVAPAARPSVSTGTVTALDQTITVGDPDSGRSSPPRAVSSRPTPPSTRATPEARCSTPIGEVIGISTAADAGRSFPGAEAQSYAVAIDTAEAIAEQISAGDGSSTIQIGIRGFLGVQVDDASGESIGGALIAGVLDGTPGRRRRGSSPVTSSPASTATPVDSGDGLTAALHGHHPGDEVRVDWTDAAGDDHAARR